MQYRQLGKSTLQISEIGFGCMSLENDQSLVTQLFHKAIDEGINFFDTADLYEKGRNEELVGEALKEKRKQVILATKVGNEWQPDGTAWVWNPHKKYIIAAVEKSLKRLQTDYIDLYQLHGGTIEDPIDETIEAFEFLHQQGKILYYGISSIRPNVIREYISRSNIVSVMMQYSLLDRRPEETCLESLAENNIAVLARGTLAKGLLAGKPADEFLQHTREEVSKSANAVKSISAFNRTPSQTALKFVLHHPGITSAIVGIRTLSHLLDVIGSTQSPVLTNNEINKLKLAAPAAVYESHR
jgi:aryl-alcohol dehydrogenase-like predicted oxidoreductase